MYLCHFGNRLSKEIIICCMLQCSQMGKSRHYRQIRTLAFSHRDTSCTPHEPHCHANDRVRGVHRATMLQKMSKNPHCHAVCPAGIGGHARRMPAGHRRSAITYGRQTIAMDRLKSTSRRIRNRRSCRRCEAACPWIAPRRRRLSRDGPCRSANSLQRRQSRP